MLDVVLSNRFKKDLKFALYEYCTQMPQQICPIFHNHFAYK